MQVRQPSQVRSFQLQQRLPRLVPDRRLRPASARQPRGRRVLHGRAQQLLPGRHQVARRRLPSRKAHHLWGRRGAHSVCQTTVPQHQNSITAETLKFIHLFTGGINCNRCLLCNQPRYLNVTRTICWIMLYYLNEYSLKAWAIIYLTLSIHFLIYSLMLKTLQRNK